MPLVAGVVGALIGSFLNVVVYRVPAGRSVVAPRSACGSCGAPIRASDNIPVLSWLLLRGRCRDCGARISARYPLVELGTAVAFGLIALWRLPGILAETGPGLAGAVLELLAYLYLAAISIALVLIDLDTRRLPDAIVLPAYPVAAALLTAAALLGGRGEELLTAGLGALVLGGAYLVIALIRPDAMGMGDVKLAGVLGGFLGFLGWPALAVGALGGVLVGGAVGLVLLAITRDGKTSLAYGPYLVAGAWIGILVGDPVATWYLSLFGIGT